MSDELEQVVEERPEKPEKKAPQVPDAEFVFDAQAANLWLAKAYARLRGVYASVRFEPEDMDLQQLSFLLSLAAASIRGRFTVRRQEHRGVLFVPRVLSKAPELSHMEKGERVGEYVAFYLP